MDIDDKELFSSAMADDPIPEVADTPAEAPATESPQPETRPRDEQGRFAAKQETPEPPPSPQAEPPVARDEASVPPWRLREIREERDAINARYLETQRQLEMLQRQMPKPEPKPSPDLFENPTGAIEYGVQQYVDPQIQELKRQIAEEREARRLDYEEASRDRVIGKFGHETVLAAYQWLGGMMQTDPSARQFYETRIHSPAARRPFEDLLAAYQQHQMTSDPDAWALKRAAEINAQKAQQQSPQGTASQERAGNRQQSTASPQGSIVKLPPSLKNIASSQIDDEGDDDASDAALFRHAMR